MARAPHEEQNVRRLLWYARPSSARGTLLRSRRRRKWLAAALGVAVVVELAFLVFSSPNESSLAQGSRIGPLEPPEEEHGFAPLEPGTEPLPLIVRRVGSVPAHLLAQVPDLIERYERIPYGLPVSLERGWVSSEFSLARLDPVEGKQVRPHYGTDLAVDTGAPVWATARGVVVFAGWKNGYGNVIYLDHENGTTTRYAHLSEMLVEVGHLVTRGETIGLSGDTGRVTGEHLHYEVRVKGTPVDPRRYLPEGLPTERPPGM
jgi:murein DD-endopeptidase MepM/ murein hydrolase activator NlpD